MSKLLAYINKEKNIFLWSLAVVGVFMAANVSLEFATDSYGYYIANNMDFWWLTFGCGRPVQGAVWFICDILIYCIPFINIYSIAYVSYIAAIVFLTAAIYEYTLLIKKYAKKEFLSFLIACVTLLNIFVVEYFLFFEKGCFMLGIFLVVKTVKYLIEFFERSEKIYLKRAVVLSFLAVFTYQNFSFLMIVLLLPFLALKWNDIRTFAARQMYAMFVMGVPLGSAFIFQKIFGETRLEHHEITENLRRTVFFLKGYLKNAHLMLPKFWFLYAIIMVLILWAIAMVKARKIIGPIIMVSYVGVGTTICGLFVYLTGVSTDQAMRVAYPFACIIGVLIQLLAISQLITEKRIIHIMEGMMILFLVVTWGKTEGVFAERYQLNQADKIWATQILGVIDEYEKNNGVSVKKIAFYYDSESNWFYDDLKLGEVSPRALFVPWSQDDILNYYTDKNKKKNYDEIYVHLRKIGVSESFVGFVEDNSNSFLVGALLSGYASDVRFTKVEPDKNIEKYFEEKNWDSFQQEQVIIIGDTAHICIY